MRSKILGEKELYEAFRHTLPAAIHTKETDDGIKASLDPMLQDIIAGVRKHRRPGVHELIGGWPYRRTPGGHTDQFIVGVKLPQKSKHRREFRLTAAGPAIRVAHLLEFGTAPHRQPRMGIMHPGARPFPIWRPAFEEHKDQVVADVGKVLFDKIAAAAMSVPGVRRR
jgi:hypothetical protein